MFPHTVTVGVPPFASPLTHSAPKIASSELVADPVLIVSLLSPPLICVALPGAVVCTLVVSTPPWPLIVRLPPGPVVTTVTTSLGSPESASSPALIAVFAEPAVLVALITSSPVPALTFSDSIVA